jgi:hypothetical protein
MAMGDLTPHTACGQITNENCYAMAFGGDYSGLSIFSFFLLS